jgi:hypothetical protein
VAEAVEAATDLDTGRAACSAADYAEVDARARENNVGVIAVGTFR